MIHGYCKSSNLLKALALHNDMVSKDIKGNCVIVSSILQCTCNMGMSSEALSLFEEFKGFGIFLDEVSYNILVDALCTQGEVEEAVQLLEEMKGKLMSLDIMHYTTLIKGYCFIGKIVDALNLF